MIIQGMHDYQQDYTVKQAHVHQPAPPILFQQLLLQQNIHQQ